MHEWNLWAVGEVDTEHTDGGDISKAYQRHSILAPLLPSGSCPLSP